MKQELPVISPELSRIAEQIAKLPKCKQLAFYSVVEKMVDTAVASYEANKSDRKRKAQ